MAAEVRGVPGGHLARSGTMVRQPLEAFEQVGHLVAQSMSGLGEVVPRCDVQRRAEGQVHPSPTGQVGRRGGLAHGEQPLGAPHRQWYDGRAGLLGERDETAHQRPHRERVGDPRLGEATDRLPLLEQPPRAEVGVHRRLPVDRDVSHAVHQRPHQGRVPDVTPRHEPDVAPPDDRRALDEDEVGVGGVRRRQQHRSVALEVLEAGPAHVESQPPQGSAAEPVGQPVDDLHAAQPR